MKNIELSYYLEEYLKNRPPFLAVIRAKEAFLYQKYLPLKRPILDVGCGDGFFAKIAFGGADIGLDLKDSRMHESNNIYKKLLEYDGIKIPLKSGSVNTVVCNSVLEHVADLDSVLSEMHRVLKKGGLLIAPVMAKPWEDYLININIYKNWMRKKQEHVNLLTKSKWIKAFEKTGFRLEKEIGHLSPKMCKVIELLHYWSIPNLILYKLTGRWTWQNKYFLPMDKKRLLNIMQVNVDPNLSGGLFYVGVASNKIGG